jgi:hypothetical protein
LHGSHTGRDVIKQEESMWKGEDMCNDENTCSLFEGGYFFYY